MLPISEPLPPAPSDADHLAAIREAGLYRRMRLVESAQGPRVQLEGRETVLLCSNDYLGLTGHPQVREAAAEAIGRWGTGAGSSRLVSGNMEPHERLEHRLAEFHRTEAALLFGSGYLANTGTVATLARRGEVVYSDALNHASIIDGCRLAGAETFVYRHRDLEHLAWALERTRDHAALIVTDGLFSMDGDTAQLGWLLELARRYGARLMVDDAHGVGAVGPGGHGTVAEAGLEGEIDIVVGTLGKSLGSYGAYVCTNRETRELLVNRARSLIFSTGLPPACAAAAEAALAIVGSEPQRVHRLAANARTLRNALARHGVPAGGSRTQIIPVAVGDPDRAVAACRRALEEGVYAQAIRPPTVPVGTSRLRLTVMSEHRELELEQAAATIAAALRAVSADGEWSIDLPDPEPGQMRIERAVPVTGEVDESALQRSA